LTLVKTSTVYKATRGSSVDSLSGALHDHLTRGNKKLYKIPDLPAGAGDVLNDGADQGAELLELFNVHPLFNLLRAVLQRINRKQLKQDEIDEYDTLRELDTFLAAYYNWWSEGGGDQQISDLAVRLHSDIEEVMLEAKTVIEVMKEHARSWRTITNSLKSLYQ